MAFPDNLRILATPPSLRWHQRRTAPRSLTPQERPDPAAPPGPDLVIGASPGALNAVMSAPHASPGGIGRPAAAWLLAGHADRAGAC
jgi:hypothetical protein